MNNLAITVHGQQLTGWQDIRLTRGVERVPSDFDIACTEKFPNTQDILVIPGDPCVVTIDGNTVLTGYVDQYVSEIAADKHNIRIRGRSKCEDLVDCSAGFLANGQFIGNMQAAQTALQLAATLCQPFGITVTNQSGMDGQHIPAFYINIGETAFEVIERVSRYAGFLSYDDVNGNLVLATPGQTSMVSGFIQGQNVQTASINLSMNMRYSDYFTVWQSIDGQVDVGSYNMNGYANDAGVPRFRPLAIVSEQVMLGVPIGQKRATWECNRRWGRSQAVKVLCDSWYDKAGTLWQPNAYATVNIPACKITGKPSLGNGWVISEVSYRQDLNAGTTAEVTLMPDLAFSVEPTVLTMFDPALQQALAQANQLGGGASP